MSTGSLFDWADAGVRAQAQLDRSGERTRVPESELQARFEAFHKANPHVYQRLVEMAGDLRRRGRERVGIGMLFEVLRWEHALSTSGDAFKLNNDYRSRYARLIMQREPGLDGVFETRELHA